VGEFGLQKGPDARFILREVDKNIRVIEKEQLTN
jgi:hypothetical protein